jgi:alanine-synthesizing transaminase
MAKEYGILVVHDIAYADIVFDGYKAPSIMQVPGAKDVAVEFFPCPRATTCPAGESASWSAMPSFARRWRGSRAITITAPSRRSRSPRFTALEGPQDCVEDIRLMYQKRRDALVKGLNEAGWKVEAPKATMFLWTPIPEPYAEMKSLEFSKKVLAEAKVAVSPGVGFGDYGDDHVRFALIENEHRIRQAVRGIKEMFRADGLMPKAAA